MSKQQRDQTTAASSNTHNSNSTNNSSNNSSGTKVDDNKSNSTVASTRSSGPASCMPLSVSASDNHHDSGVSIFSSEGQGLGQGQQPHQPPLLSLAQSVLLSGQPQQQPQPQQQQQQQQQQQGNIATLDSTTVTKREAYDSALRTVSYLVKYHHATRGDWPRDYSLLNNCHVQSFCIAAVVS